MVIMLKSHDISTFNRSPTLLPNLMTKPVTTLKIQDIFMNPPSITKKMYHTYSIHILVEYKNMPT